MLEKGRKLFPAFSSHRPGDFPRLGTFLLRGCILVYRGTLNPLLGPNCRFYPSCSSYTLAAIEKYGAVRGTWLAIRRLAKCHPWHSGGFDPLR